MIQDGEDICTDEGFNEGKQEKNHIHGTGGATASIVREPKGNIDSLDLVATTLRRSLCPRLVPVTSYIVTMVCTLPACPTC